MKVLVTGASGFLGKEVIKNLLEKNCEIIGIYNKNKLENYDKNCLNLKFFQADITDKSKLQEIKSGEKVDYIIHCAGLAHQFVKTDKEKFRRVNVVGTENICELALKVEAKRFILISSVSVYGNNNSSLTNMITEKHPCSPRDFYAESKLESELLCKQLCADNGVNLSVLRPATIIGEGDKGNVQRLINLIDKGYFIWLGHGTNYKSLIYKKDVAQACFEILEKSKQKFETYNLSAEPISMKEIVNEISLTLNKKDRYITFPEIIPKLIFKLNQKILRVGKILKLEETVRKWKSDEVFSSDLIKDKYGFKASVSAREGIRLETESFRK